MRFLSFFFAFLVSLVLLFDAVVIVVGLRALDSDPQGFVPDDWMSLVQLVVLVAAYMVPAILLVLHPGRFHRGLAGGLAVAIIPPVVMHSWLALGWGGGPDAALIYNGMRLCVLLNSAVVVWMVGSAMRDVRSPWPTVTGFAISVFTPIIAYVVTLTVGTTLEVSDILVREREEAHVVRDMLRIQNCALAWADARPGRNPPPSLTPLYLSGCLSAEVMMEIERRGISYAPRAGDGDGFLIVARLPELRESIEFNAELDETGLLKQWGYRTAAHDWDRTDGVPQALGRLRDCVEELRKQGRRMRGAKDIARAQADSIVICGNGLHRLLESTETHPTARPSHRLVYQPDDAGYRLEARPLEHGETALRSYLLTPANQMHLTLEDRPAETSDRKMPHCLPHDIGDCVPTPGAARPRVDVLHDSTMVAKRGLRVAVRVLGDTTRLPDRLTWGWTCSVPASGEVPTPHLDRSSEWTCHWPREGHLPLGDRYVVRLWLRGADGRIVWQQDTVRVLEP